MAANAARLILNSLPMMPEVNNTARLPPVAVAGFSLNRTLGVRPSPTYLYTDKRIFGRSRPGLHFPAAEPRPRDLPHLPRCSGSAPRNSPRLTMPFRITSLA